jgi:hypothetical protein
MFAAKPIPAIPASQSRTEGPDAAYSFAVATYARAAAGMIRLPLPTLAELRIRARLATEAAEEAERELMEAEHEAELAEGTESYDRYRSV